MDDLLSKLEKECIFIKKARRVHDRCVVYQTHRGPIFAVFGTNQQIDAYINFGNRRLAELECSHNLLNPRPELIEHTKTKLTKVFNDKADDVYNTIVNCLIYFSEKEKIKIEKIDEPEQSEEVNDDNMEEQKDDEKKETKKEKPKRKRAARKKKSAKKKTDKDDK